MAKELPPKRCAIYTRKSSEEGLEQAFNSLHAQREACELFVLSQRHEGWSISPTLYDDGGFSGGTTERPALQALLGDIRSGTVDVVVVYKIDRLTRSLFDFAKIVETFDAHNVSFVSVTQAFNTTNSMGRLTLNVLLSFAQFEREVTGERIRDKIAASKKRGMWMGGNIPLGYDLKDHKLVINEAEAQTVRTIFGLYAELGAVRKVKVEVDRLKLRTKVQRPDSGQIKGGLPFRVGHIYTILRNRLYRGEVHHKGEIYAGDHELIVDIALWDKVQGQMASNAAVRQSGKSSKEPSLLAGLLLDRAGNRMTPTHALKIGKRYRYYISNDLIAGASSGRASNAGQGLRIGAHEIEGHVVSGIVRFLTDQSKVLAEFCPADTPPSDANSIIARAQSFGDHLTSSDGRAIYEPVRAIVSQVRIDADFIVLQLNRQAMIIRLDIPYDTHAAQEKETLEIRMSAQLRRLGKVKRLIVAAHAPKANPDPSLIKAVVRAHQWFEMLKCRSVELIVELAKSENLPRTYVSSVIRFAFLAPDIVEAILEGTQPIDLNLDLLINMVLPIDWAEQRSVLGFK